MRSAYMLVFVCLLATSGIACADGNAEARAATCLERKAEYPREAAGFVGSMKEYCVELADAGLLQADGLLIKSARKRVARCEQVAAADEQRDLSEGEARNFKATGGWTDICYAALPHDLVDEDGQVEFTSTGEEDGVGLP